METNLKFMWILNANLPRKKSIYSTAYDSKKNKKETSFRLGAKMKTEYSI